MSDVNTPEQQEEKVEAVNFNAFDETNWQEKPIEETVAIVEENKVEEVKPVEKVETPAEQPTVESELKTNLGYDSWDAAKAELEDLKKKATGTPAEIKYANEESEKLAKALVGGDRKQVLAILQKQDQLEQLSSVEVSLHNASDIVKAAMKYKYESEGLTKDDIDYKFNKQFGIPAKPVQSDIETDEDYQEKLASWEAKKRDAEMELVIEAKLLKPELAKLKAELVLPDIQKQETPITQTPKSQEDLEAEKKFKDSFLKSAEASINELKGFNVSVKDKDVDLIPLSYDLSPEEKTNVANQIKNFAEKNFDANAIFAERWVNADGVLDTGKMIKDLAKLESDDKPIQKLVNDAANKRLELYLKEKKNINVNETTQSGAANLTKDGKTEMQSVQEFFWNN
jgi:hypothetical protein